MFKNKLNQNCVTLIDLLAD